MDPEGSSDRKLSVGDKKVTITDDGIVPITSIGDGRTMSASVAIDPAAERRLVWKFDLRILPTLAVMYLFNALVCHSFPVPFPHISLWEQDKGNLGNAKTAGLEKDLNLKGDDYNLILSIFFVPYVLAGPIVGMASKRFGPSRTLPLMMLCFGFSTLMIVAVKNFGGLLALRWILGMVGRSLDAVDLHRES
jgi:MFS family permease